MKGLGGGGGVGLTYMRIYRVGQPGGGNVCMWRVVDGGKEGADDGCE